MFASTNPQDSIYPAIYNLNEASCVQGGLPMNELKLLVSETEAFEDGGWTDGRSINRGWFG